MRRAAFVPLSIWVGAMICATFAAMRTFRMLDNDELAGDVMGGIFRMVDYLGIVAAGLAAVVCFRHKPRFILAIALLVGAGLNVFVLYPKIIARENLETFHKASEIVWSCLMLGGLILALMGPPRAESRAG
ncbi:MAG: DUF4149 domain-containing protein [Planctomycetota bacterium]